MKQCDILCVQEHYLYPDMHGFLRTLSSDIEGFIRSDNSMDIDDYPRIRKGGTAILWKKCISCNITALHNIGNDRIMAIKIQSANYQNVYVINAYLPSSNHSLSEYDNCLSMLNDAITYCNDRGCTILIGDMNGQLGPLGGARCPMAQSPRGKKLLRFLSQHNMLSLVAHPLCVGPLVTYTGYDSQYGTQIDHVCINNDELDKIVRCNVEDDTAINTSDHSPVTVEIRMNVKRFLPQLRSVYKWERGDISLYSKLMESLTEFQMTDDSEQSIDNMADILCETMIKSSDTAIPKSKFCPHRKPYWDTELNELHKTQLNLRTTWINEGRPRGRHHHSFRRYKEAKSLFAKALRLKELQFEQDRYDEIHTSEEINIRKFWRYVRSHKESIQVVHSIEKDGIIYSSPDELRDMWKEHFQELLNENDSDNVMYDQQFKEHISGEVNSLNHIMTNSDTLALFEDAFSGSEITNLCSDLPNNKAPGIDLIMYEHLKYGGPVLHNSIATLFNLMTTKVKIAARLKVGLLFPAYKGRMKRKDKDDSYRGITLMPALNKLFEKAVWERMKKCSIMKRFPHPLQMAGREGSSAMDTSFCLHEAIRYHTERGGKVFSCFLDIEKAFDKVWWDGLLYKLYQFGIRDKLWHLFKEWLIGSKCRVLYDGQLSNEFGVSRGVKQGGIMSMFLFGISIFDVHNHINQSRDGLQIDDTCMSSPSYADDIVLLSNTKNGLQKMMNYIHIYGNKWRISFSASKTKCMVFGETKMSKTTCMSSRSWELGGSSVCETESFVHLGIQINAYLDTTNKVKEMCRKGKGT